jgi:RNA recognition motif-containing protein
MNKEYTESIDSIEGTSTKGAYMVYDHCEEDNKTIEISNNASFAAIELTMLLCMTIFMIAYSII